MTYQIIDHGYWERYTPEVLPPDFQAVAAMGYVADFARRVSDGVDWYDYRKTLDTAAKSSVIATVLPIPAGEVVMAVVRDVSLVNPVKNRVIEILGVDPKDPAPHKLFEQKLLDLPNAAFNPIPPPRVTRVSPAQATTALYKRSLLDQVEAIVRNHPYPPVRLFYQRATWWDIDNPYVQAIALELGLDDIQTQVLFNEAAKL
jgi:hypothetical protein